MNQPNNERNTQFVLFIILLIVAALIDVERAAKLLEMHTVEKNRLIKDLRVSLKKYLKVKKIRVKSLVKIICGNDPVKREYFILAKLKINEKKAKTYIITAEYDKAKKLAIQHMQKYQSKPKTIEHISVKKKCIVSV